MALLVPRPELERALLNELAVSPLLLLAGPRGSGKTVFIDGLRRRWRGPSALAALEPIACSPEVLRDELHRIAGSILGPTPRRGAPMEAIHHALRERSAEGLLLLDELSELRTLAYYPGVERPLDQFIEVLARSKAPSVATTRFGFWMRQAFPEIPIRPLPPLSVDELSAAGAIDAEVVVAVTGGLAVHAVRLAEGDVEATLASELRRGGGIDAECRATMAELLHRARGYGACKSVLRVLAHEQGLNLTEVSRRLDRTPGSTRDYLRWLEEVDLVVSRDKRYFYVDPILRLWVRIHGRGELATESDIRGEVDAHLAAVGGAAAPVAAFTFPPAPSEDLVEFD
jgi:hypothetical protein